MSKHLKSIDLRQKRIIILFLLTLNKTEESMKKIILITSLILSLTLAGFVLLSACDKEGMPETEYYSIQDFINLRNFTVTSSLEKNTVCKYVLENNKIMFESDSSSEEYGDNVVYYSFDANESKIYTGGMWQSIATDDVDDYLSSIDERTGLIYNNLQANFFEEKDKNVYIIQNGHFFKELFRQKYEKFFGKDYEESDFMIEYEKQKDELFGDIDEYTVKLDCSQKKQMTLSVEKPITDGREYTAYTYTDVDRTKIKLPE